LYYNSQEGNQKMQRRTRTLKSRRVADLLGGAIVSGEVPVGSALPSEAALCERYGVSRIAVRKALKLLGAKHLVTARPRVGGVVSPRGAWSLLDADVLRWMRRAPVDGRAVVFESIEDLKARIVDPRLDVDASCVLVLKGCGPRGYPGMAEVGNMPLPRKLLEAGVRDMVGFSDARTSGTAFGTVVLHVAPESSVGGPLALVRDGDMIRLDVEAGVLELEIEPAELAARQGAWRAPEAAYPRGWYRLYVDTVTQPDEGADLDFLQGSSGSVVTRESH
jgi:hypothetical protein